MVPGGKRMVEGLASDLPVTRLSASARYVTMAAVRLSDSLGTVSNRQSLMHSIEVGAMTGLTSFQRDIRPLFADRDIHAMSKAFDLASYDDVKAHAAAIYDRMRHRRRCDAAATAA